MHLEKLGTVLKDDILSIFRLTEPIHSYRPARALILQGNGACAHQMRVLNTHEWDRII